jgi:uncharacterized membrane protein
MKVMWVLKMICPLCSSRVYLDEHGMLFCSECDWSRYTYPAPICGDGACAPVDITTPQEFCDEYLEAKARRVNNEAVSNY